mgnify:FL=1
MASKFDAQTFLSTTFNESNSTKRAPVPAGEWTSLIEKVNVRSWQSKDGTKSGLALDVTHNLDDAAVKQAMERDKVTITQGIMLDLTANGTLDMGKGKNVQLGRLREATGLNVAGQPFSFPMFEGKVVKVKVSHKPDPREGAAPDDILDT